MTAIVYKDSSQQTLESLSYTYDANGNRTSVNRLGVEPILPGITNSTYNNSLNRMDSFNGETLTYDANGNLTHKGDMVLAWDARDRLVSITNSPGGDAAFNYDAFDRRVQKTVNGVITQYLYDGLDIVEELDGAGNVKAYYIRTLDIDEPLARIDFVNNNIRYYHADAQGSIMSLSRESIKGLGIARYTYSPFGKTAITYDGDGSGAANPFRYTGREEDETGLYYYRARYYSPEMGRFISEDPIGFAGGVNFYSYVGNSPVNWVDPSGLVEVKDAYNEPIYIQPNDPDPFPSRPHGHIGHKESRLRVNVHTGEIYHNTRNTGKKLSKKGLRRLRDALRKAGLIGQVAVIISALATGVEASDFDPVLNALGEGQTIPDSEWERMKMLEHRLKHQCENMK